MAHAKLHIICGNCGCNTLFKSSIDLEGQDLTRDTPHFSPEVFIHCENCCTLHSLSDYMNIDENVQGLKNDC